MKTTVSVLILFVCIGILFQNNLLLQKISKNVNISNKAVNKNSNKDSTIIIKESKCVKYTYGLQDCGKNTYTQSSCLQEIGNNGLKIIYRYPKTIRVRTNSWDNKTELVYRYIVGKCTKWE